MTFLTVKSKLVDDSASTCPNITTLRIPTNIEKEEKEEETSSKEEAKKKKVKKNIEFDQELVSSSDSLDENDGNREETEIDEDVSNRSRLKKLWGFVTIVAKGMWEWGDWFGEKVAWELGITSSRYYLEVLEAENIRVTSNEEQDIETGGIIGFDKTTPNVNEFPRENMVEYLYKRGISCEGDGDFLDIEKPLVENSVFNIEEVEGENSEIEENEDEIPPGFIESPNEFEAEEISNI